jgi:hypothetical protein
MDVLANFFDDPRGLVAENQGLFHDEASDPAVVVVVDVGAANADGRDSNQYLVRSWSGTLALFDREVLRAAKH